MKREIITPQGPQSKAPLSPGVKVGNMLYTSGQVGIDRDEGEIPGDVGEQTRLCFENLRKVLDEAGARFEDVVKVNVYLTDVVKDFDTMNKVYKDYFPSDYPARTAVGIPSLVNPDLKVEVEMIVLLPDKGE